MGTAALLYASDDAIALHACVEYATPAGMINFSTSFISISTATDRLSISMETIAAIDSFAAPESPQLP